MAAVPNTRTVGAQPTDVTDIVLAYNSNSPDYTVTITTYLSTATVISEVHSTKLFTATATVEASNCPVTTAIASDTSKPAASTRAYTPSIVGTLIYSSLPAVSSQQGTSSHKGLPGTGAVLSQSSLSKFVTKLNDTYLSNAISRLEGSISSNISTGDLKQGSSGHSFMSWEIPVTTVRKRHPAHATSKSHLGRRSLAVSEFLVAYNEWDHTLSSSGLSVNMNYVERVTGTPQAS